MDSGRRSLLLGGSPSGTGKLRVLPIQFGVPNHEITLFESALSETRYFPQLTFARFRIKQKKGERFTSRNRAFGSADAPSHNQKLGCFSRSMVMRYEFTKGPTDTFKRTGTDLASFEREIGSLGTHEEFQLWMFRDDGESACVLANTKLAYLCVLPGNILAVDREFDGPESSTVEILLENGQLDEMPRAHCIARQLGIAAGLHYFRTGTRAPFITWFPNDENPAA